MPSASCSAMSSGCASTLPGRVFAATRSVSPAPCGVAPCRMKPTRCVAHAGEQGIDFVAGLCDDGRRMSVHVTQPRFFPRSRALGLALVLCLLLPLAVSHRPQGATPRVPALIPRLEHLFGSSATAPTPRGWRHIGVVLRFRHTAALQRLVDQISDPGSPQYRHFLSVQQFEARFGPSPSALHRVDAWLRRSGLTVTGRSANGMTILADGNRATVRRAVASQPDSLSESVASVP